jgi:protein gp37
MSDKTRISWTDATWNPIRGCSRVSEGCRHCYAERVAARFSGPGQPYHGIAKVTAPRDALDRVGGRRNGWTGEVRLVDEHLGDPLRWRKPRRIFVNSMSDLFHEKLEDWHIDRVVAMMLIQALHDTKGGHTLQTLTKRSRRMRSYLSDPATPGRVARHAGNLMEDGDGWHDAIAYREEGLVHPLLWWGVSVENQEAADERIPDLLSTPAAVRFLSCEPLIGEVDLTPWLDPSGACCVSFEACLDRSTCRAHAEWRHREHDGTDARITWVIAGCESGPGARPADVEWFRSLRDRCSGAGVPFFLKQARESNERSSHMFAITAGADSRRKSGGVIELPYLDGVQHAEFPQPKELP